MSTTCSRRTRSAALCAGLLAAIHIGAATQAPYRFTPLDGPAGSAFRTHSIAYALNGHGAVVGSNLGLSGAFPWHATLWRRNMPLDLGRPGEESEAYDVNRHLAVVGTSRKLPGNDWQAMLWQGGEATVLPDLGGSYSYARAINNAGQIAGGSSTTGDLEFLAVRWDGGVPVTLDTPPGWHSGASGINACGDVVGTASRGPGHAAEKLAHPRVEGGGGSCPLNTSETTLPMLWASDGSVVVLGTYGAPKAVNRHRWVAGCSADDPHFPFAMLWRDGVEIVLGTPGDSSVGLGIDDEGAVVGYSYKIPWWDNRHATLWREVDGAIVAVDLNTWLDDASRGEGWVLLEAHAINDDGVITGLAKNSITSLERAYRLTPP